MLLYDNKRENCYKPVLSLLSWNESVTSSVEAVGTVALDTVSLINSICLIR